MRVIRLAACNLKQYQIGGMTDLQMFGGVKKRQGLSLWRIGVIRINSKNWPPMRDPWSREPLYKEKKAVSERTVISPGKAP